MESNYSVDKDGREKWTGRFDFLITLIAYSVGTGNLWRFPYLCYKNGGGVFLIPYFISLIGIGVPIFLLQVTLGQFMSRSGPSAWNLYPLAKGLGVCTMIINGYLVLYYIVVISWSLFYIYSAVSWDEMPWTYCLENFGSSCFDKYSNNSETKFSNESLKEPAELFWTKNVLNLSENMENIGTIQPHLALSLFVSWIIVYICIIRGIKWTSKIVWFTGIFPYVMIAILFIRGVTLKGAWNGIVYYLKPDFSKLTLGSVWLDAGTQIMYSMSLGDGNIITIGSYNNFHDNSIHYALVYCVVNCLTSFFGGFCIFSTLGYMAHERNISVSEVSAGGPGLTFIAYPTALSLIPIGSKLFTICFFLMILFLGMDGQFVGVEGLSRQIMDAFPKFFNFKFAREILITTLCVTFFSFGLIFTTNAGMYYFQILDFYSASGAALLFLCFCQSVTIAYFYGGKRFLNDIEHMYPIGLMRPFLTITWYFITPILCLVIAVIYWVNFTPLTYGDYIYPKWSDFVGWLIALPTILAIPVSGVVQLCKNRNETGRYKAALLRAHQLHAKSEQPYEIVDPRTVLSLTNDYGNADQGSKKYTDNQTSEEQC